MTSLPAACKRPGTSPPPHHLFISAKVYYMGSSGASETQIKSSQWLLSLPGKIIRRLSLTGRTLSQQLSRSSRLQKPPKAAAWWAGSRSSFHPFCQSWMKFGGITRIYPLQIGPAGINAATSHSRECLDAANVTRVSQEWDDRRCRDSNVAFAGVGGQRCGDRAAWPCHALPATEVQVLRRQKTQTYFTDTFQVKLF